MTVAATLLVTRTVSLTMRETLEPYSRHDIALMVGLVVALLFVSLDLFDGNGFDPDAWYVLLGQSVGVLVAIYGGYGVFKRDGVPPPVERTE